MGRIGFFLWIAVAVIATAYVVNYFEILGKGKTLANFGAKG